MASNHRSQHDRTTHRKVDVKKKTVGPKLITQTQQKKNIYVHIRPTVTDEGFHVDAYSCGRSLSALDYSVATSGRTWRRSAKALRRTSNPREGHEASNALPRHPREQTTRTTLCAQGSNARYRRSRYVRCACCRFLAQGNNDGRQWRDALRRASNGRTWQTGLPVLASLHPLRKPHCSKRVMRTESQFTNSCERTRRRNLCDQRLRKRCSYASLRASWRHPNLHTVAEGG